MIIEPGTPAMTGNTGCDWPFTVTGVAQTSFYQVQAGYRTPVTYALSDLDSSGWSITVTIGGP